METVTTARLHGRILEPGTEFKVPWEGRFKFKYAKVNEAGELVEVTGYGGKGDYRSFRTFTPERIKTVHNIKGRVR